VQGRQGRLRVPGRQREPLRKREYEEGDLDGLGATFALLAGAECLADATGFPGRATPHDAQAWLSEDARRRSIARSAAFRVRAAAAVYCWRAGSRSPCASSRNARVAGSWA
jgi:hypothetical protein